MILTSLTIKNFRNHSYKTYDFIPKLNAFIGENASGKTNLVEAIYYLSLGRSFRTLEQDNLIKRDKEYAYIEGIVKEGDIKRKIQISLSKEGRQVSINGKPINRLSSLSKVANVLVFEPKDVNLFKGPPKGRRNFLDINLSKKNEPYLTYISSYEKVLKDRNELLKKDKIDLDQLRVYTEMMVKLSAPIINYREQFIKDINNILNKIIRALVGECMYACVEYKPFVAKTDTFDEDLKNAFIKAEESDIKKKATSIGPHRDDFKVSLNGHEIGEFGSQGENRIVALALKLSPYFLIQDEDRKPIVVLDDVLSELDKENQERLLNFVQKLGQVFITGTKLDYKNAKIFSIKKGDN